MKRINFIPVSAILACAALFSSCADELDSDKYFDDRVTIETVFTDVNMTNGWLAQAFRFLKGDLADCKTKEVAYSICFADDMYYGDRDPNKGADYPYMHSYNAFKRGDYDENFGSSAWTDGYKGIYQASIFINNIDMNTKLSQEDRTDLKGQARFLRAYYYWLLLRRYGPVPIMPVETADYTLSYDELSIPRSSYEEVAEFISDEMIQAAKELKMVSRIYQEGVNTDATAIIRPTKGAALATRALAYLYAASPLANGQLSNGHPRATEADFVAALVNKDGKELLSKTYDESKWARAAAACRDVIELGGGYELYHSGVNTTNNETAGRPKTITPPDDGDFSGQNWPEGWADIDPYLSYRDLFTGEVGLENTEIIFSRGYNMTGHQGIEGFVVHNLPTTLNGFNCHGLTQKMVDAYYMNDGTNCPGMNSEPGYEDADFVDTRERATGFTENSPRKPATYYANFPPLDKDVSMQYANREPRFYASVGYNGSHWWSKDPDKQNSKDDYYPQVFYYRGTTRLIDADGNQTILPSNGYNNSPYYLRTGVACKKWVNPNDWRKNRDGGDYGNIVKKWEPAIRYADILLMYAEALNELTTSYTIPSWNGNTTYTVSRDVNEMKRGIRPVRCRAGVPDYDAATYGDQTLMRKTIKRERMIELMGEGKRYYDLRRWMDAPYEESLPIYGCNILMTATEKEEFHQIVPCYDLPTVFSDKMYFWPISTDEIKRNKNLVQNPGWHSFL
ncbi:MAG: RagB/SusD family nutrient uptake outer membrane protein [Clostridium sp.]|nr:RagB/SusD family nutrient uptake outer membrane protein [Clostridium sp.]